MEGEFTLDDYVKLFEGMVDMSSVLELPAKWPKYIRIIIAAATVEANLRSAKCAHQMRAIFLSMTPDERQNPEVVDSSRIRRIALGSGTQPQTVDDLLRQFKATAGWKRMEMKMWPMKPERMYQDRAKPILN